MSTVTLPRRRVTRSFKTRGLTLQAAALEGIMSVLTKENDPEQVLQAILEGCKERGTSPLVTMDLMSAVVADLTRDADDVNEEAIQLLNAFETPRLSFDAMRKQFALHTRDKPSLFGEASDKVNLLLYMIRRYGCMSTCTNFIAHPPVLSRLTCMLSALRLFISAS
jgi:hypothetical protein